MAQADLGLDISQQKKESSALLLLHTQFTCGPVSNYS